MGVSQLLGGRARLPAPKVYAYDCKIGWDIGAAYILLSQ